MRGLAGAPTSSGVRTNSDTSMAASEGVIVGSVAAGAAGVVDCAAAGDVTNPSRIEASVTARIRPAKPAHTSHHALHSRGSPIARLLGRSTGRDILARCPRAFYWT